MVNEIFSNRPQFDENRQKPFWIETSKFMEDSSETFLLESIDRPRRAEFKFLVWKKPILVISFLFLRSQCVASFSSELLSLEPLLQHASSVKNKHAQVLKNTKGSPLRSFSQM